MICGVCGVGYVCDVWCVVMCVMCVYGVCVVCGMGCICDVWCVCAVCVWCMCVVWITIIEDESMDSRGSRRDMAGVGAKWREGLNDINTGRKFSKIKKKYASRESPGFLMSCPNFKYISCLLTSDLIFSFYFQVIFVISS